MQELEKGENPDEKKLNLSRASSIIIKKKNPLDETAPSTPSHANKGWIGPLSLSERMEKVLRYLQKKRMKSTMKKFCYKCRKQVAEKRLRIKGRFVTKKQAFEILGITSDELKSIDIIQKLLENHVSEDYPHF
jgi:hypothetical protein